MKLTLEEKLYIYGKWNDYHLSILEGEILGDGCICSNGKNGAYHFSHATISKEYEEYLIKNMPRGLFSENQPYTCYPNIKNKNSKIYYKISTNGFIDTIHECYKRFYPEGEKSIPKDLVLNKVNCFHWYVGDGTNIKNGHSATFCTNGFKKAEVELLISKFESIDLYPKMRKCYRKEYDKNYYLINFLKDETEKLLRWLGDSKIKFFRYKWGL